MKLLKLAFILLGMMPLLPFKLKSSGLILGLLAGIYLVYKHNAFKKIKIHKNFIYGFVLFLLYAFSLIFSEDKIATLKYLETSLSFVLFPVFFILISHLHWDSKSWEDLKYTFYKTYFFSSVLYAVLLFAYIYHLGYFQHKASYDLSVSYLRAYFWGLGDHPIYISMFLMLALFVSIKLLTPPKTIPSLVIWTGNLIILLALFFLARKGILLAGLIALLYYISKNFNNRKKKYLLFSLITSILLSFMIIFPESTNRIVEIFQKETYNQQVDLSRSTSVRLAIYKCSWETGKNTGLFGTGMGDVKASLKKCFVKKYPVLTKQKLNTHNAYFNVWIGMGWLGLLFFIYYLYSLLKIASNAKNDLFVMILLFFAVFFLFENALDRQNGVLLFNLFVSLYLFENAYLSGNKSKREKEEFLSNKS